jgi:hypothetical protein
MAEHNHFDSVLQSPRAAFSHHPIARGNPSQSGSD